MTNILKPFSDKKITSTEKALEDLAKYASERPKETLRVSPSSNSSASDLTFALMEFTNVFQIGPVMYDPSASSLNKKKAERNVLIKKDFSESHLFSVWKASAEDAAKAEGNLRFFVPSLQFFYSICKSIALAKKEQGNGEVERRISTFLTEKFSSSHMFLTTASLDYVKGDSIQQYKAHYKPDFIQESIRYTTIHESNSDVTDKHTKTLQCLLGTEDDFKTISNVFTDVFDKKLGLITGLVTDPANTHPVLLQVIKDFIYLRCDGEYEARYPVLRVCY